MRWILLLLLACDGGKAEAAAKKAAEEEAAAKREAEEKAAQRKAQREAEAKAEEDAKQAKAAALEGLVGLPDKVPKKLEQACKQMLAAYDKYMVSVLEGDLKTKWETGGNEMQLKVYRAECLKRTPEIAACQTFALGKMGPEHRTDMGEIFTRCAQKYGGA